MGNESGDAPYPFYIPTNLKVNENGFYLPDNYDRDKVGTSWVPGEADFLLREGNSWIQSGWFWNTKNQGVLSVGELMEKYYTSVGSNTNMFVGRDSDRYVGRDATGRQNLHEKF